MERTIKNYVLDAANAYYRKRDNDNRVLKLYNNAVERFSVIHILNGMAHTETLKAIDMIDDKGLRKHLVKRHLKAYEARYEQYEHFMHTHMEKSAWMLLQDYARVSCTKIDKRLVMLKLACHDYLNKLKVKDADILGQCESALLMWDIAYETFKAYFKMYKDECGIDFSADFAYANMRKCYESWMMLVNELAKGAKGVDFGMDKRCLDSWRALKNELNNEKFFDDCAMQALTLNEGMLGRFQAELDRLKKEAATD